jgi:hypothetical protein
MAVFGSQNFTTFNAVNLRGSVALRFAGSASGLEGTLSIKSDNEGVRAWQLPAKSGTFPIMGTFNVQLPAIVAGAFDRTAVTVSGIRVEDGLVVTIQGDPLKNLGAIQNPAQLIAASAGNGSITLTFASLGGTTTAYQEIPCAYVAVR